MILNIYICIKYLTIIFDIEYFNFFMFEIMLNIRKRQILLKQISTFNPYTKKNDNGHL